jgi:hypothetical protein
MATNRSGHKPGGGIASNKVVHRPHGKTEPIANKYRPQGVSQYGQMQGTHTTNRTESNYRGEPKRGGRGYEPPGMISDPVKAVGVGGGREVMRSGGQGTHGAVNPGNPRPAGRDILREFGPDKRSY